MLTSGTIEVFRGNTYGPVTPVLKLSDGTPFVLPEGGVLLFTVKRIGDVRQDDEEALIVKDVTETPWSLTAEETDIAEDLYRYDIKAVAPNVETNSISGDFLVSRRVGVRDA